ncbi:enoyl-CoA hydratase/isomerase family protein [Pseudonocardia ailaonensis]
MLLGGVEFRRWLTRRGDRTTPSNVSDPVLLERQRDRLVIRLNRPERRNAYGRQLRDSLVDALDLARHDHSVATIELSGIGPAFCAGGDLDEFGTTPDLATAHFVRTRGGAALPLHELRDRVEVLTEVIPKGPNMRRDAERARDCSSRLPSAETRRRARASLSSWSATSTSSRAHRTPGSSTEPAPMSTARRTPRSPRQRIRRSTV